VIYLRSVQGIPLARLSHVLRDLFGLDISEGALVNILDASREPFAMQTSLIKARLLAGTALASDETGMRVARAMVALGVPSRRQCRLHRRQTPLQGGCACVPRRLAPGLLDFGPLWRPDGLGNARASGLPRASHPRRPIRDRLWRRGVRARPEGLLKRACAIGRRRDALTDGTLKIYEADLNRRLDRLMSLIPADQAGVKLQTIIKKVRRHLFVFVTNRDLTATNNGSERALRPCAVYRKITNGFRSEWGAALYADIRSVVETARRRSVRAIDAIRLTLQGLPIPSVA